MTNVLKSGSLNLLEPSGSVEGVILFLHLFDSFGTVKYLLYVYVFRLTYFQKSDFFQNLKTKIDPNYIYGSTSRRPLNFLSLSTVKTILQICLCFDKQTKHKNV